MHSYHFEIAGPGMIALLFIGLAALTWFATNVGEAPKNRAGFSVVYVVLLVCAIGFVAYYPLSPFIARLFAMFSY